MTTIMICAAHFKAELENICQDLKMEIGDVILIVDERSCVVCRDGALADIH